VKLLVVDDEEDARLLQSNILTHQGYEVSTAANGLEALNSIKQSRPDLIISDVLMPEMDGYELCRRLKTSDELKDIPLVFYSAHYLDEKDKQMAIDLGALQIIQKPMESDKFLGIIGDIIAQAPLARPAGATSLAKDDSALERDHEQRLTQMLYGKLKELKESQGLLMKALKGTIGTVAMVVEVRDPFTAGHQQRVARLAEAIAHEMGLDEGQIEGIRMGASIHDIGKVQIPAEILSKPAALSDIEYRIVQEHPGVGYNILKDVAFPWPVADIAYQHHERLDGSGYPLGLKGEAICLEARVVAVADVVEAMLSHRPYRAAWKIEDALHEISSRRGTHFDPQAVDACLQLFHDKGYDIAGA